MKSTTNKMFTIFTYGAIVLAILALGLLAFDKISGEIFAIVFSSFTSIGAFLFGKKGAKKDGSLFNTLSEEETKEESIL